jgi:uncharacterized protein
LKLAFEDIPEGVSALDFVCGSEEIHLEAEGISFAGPVIADLHLFKQGDKVFLKAKLSVDAETECARCLSPVHMILEGHLQNQYRPLPKMGLQPLDDIGIGYYSGEYIDLSDDFRESLLLELPARVLCSEDCRGLCPYCGKDLNERKCSCPSEPEEVQTSRFGDLIKTLEIGR